MALAAPPPAADQQLLEDAWDVAEFCRSMIDDADKWESTFVTSLKGGPLTK